MEQKYSPEQQKFLSFCFLNNVGNFSISNNKKEKYFLFESEDMIKLAKMDLLTISESGGYVKGLDKNKTGGIYLLTPWENERYRYIGYVLPGFYISGYKSYPTYKNEFQEMESSIENFTSGSKGPLIIPHNCRIIDTKEKKNFFIVIPNCPNFNFSNSTVSNHLNRIIEIENSFSYDN